MTIKNLLAAAPTDVIGRIIPPPSIRLLATPGIDPVTGKFLGVVVLLNSLLKLIFIVAGLYGFLNIIVSGFGFMTAGGDAKKIAAAWERIWQSFLGLLIIAASFLVAAIIGIVLFGDPFIILNPKL